MLADVADQSVLATRPAAWPPPSRRRRAIAPRHDVSYRWGDSIRLFLLVHHVVLALQVVNLALAYFS
eukprot:5256690-Heterocapsa_arctica.AAC.1